jgi:hypothetical protein
MTLQHAEVAITSNGVALTFIGLHFPALAS